MRESSATGLLPYEARLLTPVERLKSLVKGLLAGSARPLGTLVRVATREPAIGLTFDDGPHPEDTPSVLDVLDRHHARATFFMVGASASRYPELVARVASAGHSVAHHSWDHSSFRRLEEPARRAQLDRTAEALAPHGLPFFRPPFGEQSLASLLAARRVGYTVVAYDVVGEDWRDSPAEHIVDRVMRRLRRGSIVVLHDTLYVTEDSRYRDRAPLRQALDALLSRLSPGFRFVTLPELLAMGRPVWGHHYHRLPAGFHERLRRAEDV